MYIRFEALYPLSFKIMILWDVMPCVFTIDSFIMLSGPQTTQQQ